MENQTPVSGSAQTENRPLLDEGRYARNKKLLIRCAIAIMVVGLFIGGGLIAGGIVRKIDADKAYDEAIKAADAAYDAAMKSYEGSETEATEPDTESYGTSFPGAGSSNEDYDNWFNDFANEAMSSYTTESTRMEAEHEAAAAQMNAKSEAGFAQMDAEFAGNVMIGAGAFVVIASLMAGGGLVLFAKKREIAAFTTQQMMPVAQEGIDKMTPTVSKAAGNIAGAVAEGIARGKTNAQNGENSGAAEVKPDKTE